MSQKYVRHSKVGFVLWARSDDLWHLHIGKLLLARLGGTILSAGFVTFEDELSICYGESESLEIKSRKDDSDALAIQLGMKPSGAST